MGWRKEFDNGKHEFFNEASISHWLYEDDDEPFYMISMWGVFGDKDNPYGDEAYSVNLMYEYQESDGTDEYWDVAVAGGDSSAIGAMNAMIELMEDEDAELIPMIKDAINAWEVERCS